MMEPSLLYLPPGPPSLVLLSLDPPQQDSLQEAVPRPPRHREPINISRRSLGVSHPRTVADVLSRKPAYTSDAFPVSSAAALGYATLTQRLLLAPGFPRCPSRFIDAVYQPRVSGHRRSHPSTSCNNNIIIMHPSCFTYC